MARRSQDGCELLAVLWLEEKDAKMVDQAHPG